LNIIMQGLSLSGMGLGLTFAALGLLILAMILLEYIFRTRRLVPDEREMEETPVVSTLARDMEEEEVAAAIAVALAHLRLLDLHRSGLGTTLESGHGAWWTMGRIRRRSQGRG
jgi:Na+-transporting methylmalonyl-CoA/oxaloacetate decarboxylase gamma subunit